MWSSGSWEPTLLPIFWPAQRHFQTAEVFHTLHKWIEVQTVGRSASHGRALELPTAGAKPKSFGACSEKRLCARQLVLGTAIMGIEL